jgi:hypothetical protein
MQVFRIYLQVAWGGAELTCKACMWPSEQSYLWMSSQVYYKACMWPSKQSYLRMFSHVYSVRTGDQGSLKQLLYQSLSSQHCQARDHPISSRMTVYSVSYKGITFRVTCCTVPLGFGPLLHKTMMFPAHNRSQESCNSDRLGNPDLYVKSRPCCMFLLHFCAAAVQPLR